MALSFSLVWEVRTTGNDANGGAFRAAATGTDYSQQDAAQVTYTDLVIGATTTQLTSAATAFTSAHVGNTINITGGTGFTTGRYEVMSVTGGIATMDRSVGTASSTGGGGKLGGCLATLGTLATGMVASNKAFIKAGTYTMAGATFSQDAGLPWSGGQRTKLIGYSSNRSDGGRATLKLTAASASILTLSGAGIGVYNFLFDADGLASSTCLSITQSYSTAYNCKFLNFGYRALDGSNANSLIVLNCEATSSVSGATSGIRIGQSGHVGGCWVHDCNMPFGGIELGFASTADRNVVSNIAGGGHGIVLTFANIIKNNTVHGISSCGIFYNGPYDMGFIVLNNVISECGLYGIVLPSSAGLAADPRYDGNAFYACTAGNRLNMDDTTANPQSGVGPYTNVYDIQLTVSPFVDKTTNDYRLNTTAGGGAACRATAVSNTLPGLAVAGYADMGALQHQDSGGSSGPVSRPVIVHAAGSY